MFKKIQFILSIYFGLMYTAIADTHYVATSGANAGDCTVQANPCLTLNYAISQMAGGDTLEIADGVYSGAENDLDKNSNIPSGTINNYTVIKAANIDTATSNVTLTSDFYFQVNSSEADKEIHYVEFHGLKIKNNRNKNISGHHIKIFKTAFEGGPSTNNNITFSVGHNNLPTHSNHILLEDVWSYGPGGRYKIMVYNSEDVVVRRAVIRLDGGWGCDGSNPEAGMTIYNSKNVELQNVVVIDGISDKDTTNGNCQGRFGFYNVSNASGSTQHDNTRIVGSISMNNDVQVGIAWDDSRGIPSATLENSVVYNNGSGASDKGINVNGVDKNITIKNVSVIGHNSHAIAKYGTNNTFDITNTIILNNGGEPLKNTTATSDVLCYGNSGSVGCNISNVDPISSGLLHLPRIETASYLETAGTGATRIGAHIINKIGLDGTLYGDANYNTEQGALWPWPLETRIASDMCSVRNSGFCSTSLTDYIWSALGTATPSNLQPMPTPTGVGYTKN